MRVLGAIIGVAVGAYVVWKTMYPLPESADACVGDYECGGPPAQAGSLDSGRPGLRIVLYDPRTETILRR